MTNIKRLSVHTIGENEPSWRPIHLSRKFDTLTRLESLDISKMTDDSLTRLPHTGNLTRLVCVSSTLKGISSVNLKELSVAGLNWRQMTRLTHFESLESLSVGLTLGNVKHIDWRFLEQCTRLQGLRLDIHGVMTPMRSNYVFMPCAVPLSCIRHLNTKNLTIYRPLYPGLKTRGVVNFYNNYGLRGVETLEFRGDVDFLNLENLPNLTKLCLPYLNDDDARLIGKIDTLRSLHLKYCSSIQFRDIYKLNTVQHLTVDNTDAKGDVFITFLHVLISEMPQINSLKLPHLYLVKYENVQKICNELCSMPNLRQLVCTDLHFDDVLILRQKYPTVHVTNSQTTSF
mmetsp:Transcript_5715/g.6201  ORF Transcript_5715/g.6201 Transcript_5715/m.6201 type:complete len:343 (-) Transcript_5715:264-1292(-)